MSPGGTKPIYGLSDLLLLILHSEGFQEPREVGAALQGRSTPTPCGVWGIIGPAFGYSCPLTIPAGEPRHTGPDLYPNV